MQVLYVYAARDRAAHRSGRRVHQHGPGRDVDPAGGGGHADAARRAATASTWRSTRPRPATAINDIIYFGTVSQAQSVNSGASFSEHHRCCTPIPIRGLLFRNRARLRPSSTAETTAASSIRRRRRDLDSAELGRPPDRACSTTSTSGPTRRPASSSARFRTMRSRRPGAAVGLGWSGTQGRRRLGRRVRRRRSPGRCTAPAASGLRRRVRAYTARPTTAPPSRPRSRRGAPRPTRAATWRRSRPTRAPAASSMLAAARTSGRARTAAARGASCRRSREPAMSTWRRRTATMS